MSRILITGSAGFIGSHLSERLVHDGHEVIGMDNLFTGSKNNIKHLFHEPNFEFIRHDVRLPYSIECDEIYNLACPASPYHYQRFPVQTITTSLQGMIYALNNARRLNIKVLQASTSEVYGDPDVHLQTEEYRGSVSTTSIRGCYDESKRCTETLCMDYHRQFNTKVKIARIFNTYGPRLAENDGRVISNFILQALRGEDITIYGDGNQTRSFQYVDDLVEGLIRLMATDDEITGPINIGNPNEFTILELAEKVIQMTGTTSKIVFKPLPSDDPMQRCPDISKAMETLNWMPKISLHDGLILTINYFKKL